MHLAGVAHQYSRGKARGAQRKQGNTTQPVTTSISGCPPARPVKKVKHACKRVKIACAQCLYGEKGMTRPLPIVQTRRGEGSFIDPMRTRVHPETCEREKQQRPSQSSPRTPHPRRGGQPQHERASGGGKICVRHRLAPSRTPHEVNEACSFPDCRRKKIRPRSFKKHPTRPKMKKVAKINFYFKSQWNQ